MMLPEEAIPRNAPVRKYRNVSRTSLLVSDAGVVRRKEIGSLCKSSIVLFNHRRWRLGGIGLGDINQHEFPAQ